MEGHGLAFCSDPQHQLMHAAVEKLPPKRATHANGLSAAVVMVTPKAFNIRSLRGRAPAALSALKTWRLNVSMAEVADSSVAS